MPLPCFSYPAEVPRRMPSGSCFSYPGTVPPDIRNRDTARPGPDAPVSGACVSYPVAPCFSYPHMCLSYPDDVRLGTGNRDAARPDLRRMATVSHCFRY